VLDRPEIPLHTNGSKNDIRCHVKSQSLGRPPLRSRSPACTPSSASPRPKLGISFWNYDGARLNLPGAAVPPLANLILAKDPTALTATTFAPAT
jgi:hypothetical protein